MVSLRSPVRWFGGKTYLAPWIIDHFPPHRFYLEPFGGGASVLLNKPPSEVESYNDLDERIVNLFRVLRDDGPEFIKQIQLTPYSEDEFDRARHDPRTADPIGRAVDDFTCWRQGFGGLGRSWCFSKTHSRRGMAGNVSGWLSAIDALENIIQRLRTVQLFCRPAVELIAQMDHADLLVYADPPYVHSTRTESGNYTHEMTDADHEQLADVLNRCAAKVVLSGYGNPLYDRLYAGWHRTDRRVSTRLAGQKDGSKTQRVECLWMNFNPAE